MSVHTMPTIQTAYLVDTDVMFARRRSERRAMDSMLRRKMRDRQIRRSYLVLIGILAAAFTAMLLFFSLHSMASESFPAAQNKYYRDIVVPFGDDLEDIVTEYREAARYDDDSAFIKEICRINGISMISLRSGVRAVAPGDHLIIPYYSSERK